VSMIIAAVIVWGAPQTWDWTREIGWPKIVAIILLFISAVLVMTTQAFNPFIYFMF